MIPGGITSILQPLDVFINKPLKEHYRSSWLEWFNREDERYTESGNRKRPSYEQLVTMTIAAVNSVDVATIASAFTCCGLIDTKQSLWTNFSLLNSKLQQACFVTATHETTRISISCYKSSMRRMKESERHWSKRLPKPDTRCTSRHTVRSRLRSTRPSFERIRLLKASMNPKDFKLHL